MTALILALSDIPTISKQVVQYGVGLAHSPEANAHADLLLSKLPSPCLPACVDRMSHTMWGSRAA